MRTIFKKLKKLLKYYFNYKPEKKYLRGKK